MFREGLSLIFTLAAVCVVVSLVWYLIEDRPGRPSAASRLAAAHIMFFAGLLSSQTYMLLNTRWVMDGNSATDISPYWPFAAAAAILALGGAFWMVWLFRPKVPIWIWALGVAGVGAVIVTGRIIIF